MTFPVKVKNIKAKRILEDLAALGLIEIGDEIKRSSKTKAKTERTLTHIASERSLAKTWSNEQENAAWQDL